MIFDGPMALVRRCADKLRPAPAAAVHGGQASGSATPLDIFERPARVPTPVHTSFAPMPLMAAAGQREMYQTQLNHIVDAINAPNWLLEDADGIEQELTDMIAQHPHETQSYVWRGIVKRIRGVDPRADLDQVLYLEPSHRLALLNHAAAPITCPAVREDANSALQSLSSIETFLHSQPADTFAWLIAATLIVLFEPESDAALATLEGLYMSHPPKAPTAALMAATLQGDGRRHAASDFAREALRLDAKNALAHNILKKNGAHEEVGDASVPYIRPPGAPRRTGADLAFMAPYAQQDPDYSAARSTL